MILLCVLGVVSVKAFSEPDKTRESQDPSTITIQSLFPVESGLKWRYERTSAEGVSHYVTNVLRSSSKDNHIYSILTNPFGVSYYELTPEMLLLKGIAPAEEPEKVSYYEEGNMIRLQNPIRKGAMWEDRASLDKADGGILTSYRTVISGWGKAEVPAGVFDAVITSTTLNTVFIDKETGLGKGVFSSEQIWYSPGIGIVRRTNFLLYGKDRAVPVRDDKLEEFIREEPKKIK